MQKKMLINALDADEMRIAVVEDGRLEAFFAEAASGERTRGNIYKGVVTNVEPSLEAAFVDFGQPKNGFLQINDVMPEAYQKGAAGDAGPVPINKALKRGQDILVQVVKEAAGTKGASLTTYISLPGQSLVLTPGREKRGVSRKIASEAERKRLLEVLEALKLPEGFGIIARTAAEGRSKKDILTEGRQLHRLWQDVLKQSKKTRPRSLVHKEEELALRAVRDLFTSDLSEILVDDPEVFSRLERFVSMVNPRRKGAVKLYRENRPIFAKYEVEDQLKAVFQPRVELACGGSIIISPTEALVSVDVNSGKAISGEKIEQTALNVNLEAAAEVARQLRLRDLGGLVVIDFIDMRERKNQRALVKKLKDEFKKDKAKVTVGSISRFGLLEMSRQRLRSPVDFGQNIVCPVCQGRGVVRSAESLGRAVLRTLEHKLRRPEGQGWMVRVPPEVAHYLQNVKRSDLSRLESRSGLCLEIKADHGVGSEGMEIKPLGEPWPLPVPPEEEAAPAQAPPPAQPEPAPKETPVPKEASKPRSRSRGRRKPKAAPPAGPETPSQAQEPAQPQPAQPKPAQPKPAESGQEAGAQGPAAQAPAKKRRGRRRSGAARRRAKKAQEARQEGQEEGR